MSSWDRCAVALGSYHYIPYAVLAVVYLGLELMPSKKTKKV